MNIFPINNIIYYKKIIKKSFRIYILIFNQA